MKRKLYSYRFDKKHEKQDKQVKQNKSIETIGETLNAQTFKIR